MELVLDNSAPITHTKLEFELKIEEENGITVPLDLKEEVKRMYQVKREENQLLELENENLMQ